MKEHLKEQIEDIAKERAEWLLDAVAMSTQDRRYLRGEDEYDEVAGEAILLNGEKTITVAINKVLEIINAKKRVRA